MKTIKKHFPRYWAKIALHEDSLGKVAEKHGITDQQQEKLITLAQEYVNKINEVVNR